MNWTPEYALLDMGQGRKLEQFGPCRVDRPCPAAADFTRLSDELWRAPRLQYVRQGNDDRGRWLGTWPKDWMLAAGPLHLGLHPTPAGQLGVFPEQLENWEWLEAVCRLRAGPRVLNLFAYTGASSLAAARGGAEVTHVDASRPVVQWARRNAHSSGMDHLPIRWIVEDARRFARREKRRGRMYHGIILDPPTYGHGPQGTAWQLERDLPGLIQLCIDLLQTGGLFLLLTCHTAEFDGVRLAQLVQQAGLPEDGTLERIDLALPTLDGRQLPAGHGVRWCAAAKPC